MRQKKKKEERGGDAHRFFSVMVSKTGGEESYFRAKQTLIPSLIPSQTASD